MPTLPDLVAARPTFTLDELADTANAHLPDRFEGDARDARVRAKVNPRLVRHYVGEALLDPPYREGRRARYGVDHLLQLLALRHLLARGVPAHTIGSWLRERERDVLLALAQGAPPPAHAPGPTPSGAPPTAPVTAPPAAADDAPSTDARAAAQAALDAIRARAARPPTAVPPPPTGAPLAPPPTPPTAPDAVAWDRVPLLDGVELHVRSDVRLPASLDARQRLLDHVVRQIVLYAQGRD